MQSFLSRKLTLNLKLGKLQLLALSKGYKLEEFELLTNNMMK